MKRREVGGPESIKPGYLIRNSKAEGKATPNLPSGEIRFPRAGEVWPEPGKRDAGHRL